MFKTCHSSVQLLFLDAQQGSTILYKCRREGYPWEMAITGTQKQRKKCITGTARLYARLRSQNMFPHPLFTEGRLRHREIFARSTSSHRPRNNNKKRLFKLSSICAEFQCNFPIQKLMVIFPWKSFNTT